MVKRGTFLFLLILILCLTSAAMAATELTWDQTCTKKTSSSTTLYVKLEDSESLTATSTLSAGTYIHTTGSTVEGKAGISYSANNSDPLYGYIDPSVIVNATKTITLASGRTVTVPEALVRSRTAMDLYLEMEYGETTEGSKTYTDEEGNEQEYGNEKASESGHGSNDAAWADGVARAAIKNGAYTRTVYRDEAGNETEVRVRYMGLSRSMVELNGTDQLVDTWRLTWDTTAPENKVLAVVNVTKSPGYAKLHSKSSTKSLVMCQVKTNRVLRVISTGKNWTLVDIDEGPRGYIATRYLTFHPNVEMQYTTAVASVKGRTKGKDVVPIRCTESTKARKTEVSLGTPLTVCSTTEKWAEVDTSGYHGYILTKHMTLDETE